MNMKIKLNILKGLKSSQAQNPNNLSKSTAPIKNLKSVLVYHF